ncbi:polysaccharide biosynthesis protein [Viridibacillus sp. FSL E2-0187]|uniref:putative polysaccharide biosynthesis protein n=1 Tax=Viridibacillus TaxID=496496 RepID=UPI00187B1441|nr:polysaccharide biosynthesis protein [Viridibacillus sp. JNUCC-6]QOV12824.1 polysaccharide biosynthesis protein [Viridibacillus sp. JNUCC-6]
MTSFFHGTFLLMGAVFLSKLLGFLYRMQFMRVAGEEAVGTYMAAYPAFIFFLSLIQLGIPIAVAKIIAELHAKKKKEQLSAVMRTATLLTFLAGIILFPLIMLFIPYLSNNLLHDGQTMLILYVGLATVPVAAASALLKSFFQGLARIAETAWSQTMEQVIRIILITFLLPYGVNVEEPALTAGFAMVITAIAEAVAFLYLYWHYRKVKRSGVLQPSKEYYPPNPILKVALPSTGSKIFGTFTWFLEPIIFLKALTLAGMTTVVATKLYGVISGVLVPLLLFPAFVPFALSVVLIPAVSDAVARGNHRLLKDRVQISLRLSTLVGCFAATYFFIHGDELAMKLFHLQENRGYVKLLSPVFFFYYIQSPLNSILQAVDEANAAMMNAVYGGIGKLFIMFVLASQSGLQEKGAVIAIGFGVLVTSFLHIATIRQKKYLHTGFRLFVVPYGIFIFVVVLRTMLIPTAGLSVIWNSAITLGILSVLLILFNQIRWRDFMYLTRTIRKRL